MKYLKKFESIFGHDEPVSISTDEFIRRKKELGSEFFSKNEQDILVQLLESNGYDFIGQEEWEDSSLDQLTDTYNLGLTYLHFNFFSSGDENPQPFEVSLFKCKDEFFYISFYQEEYDGDGDDYFTNYQELYECDGFECVCELIKKEAKLV